MIADEDLVGNVSDELVWDPKVHAERIAVAADDGKVTQRGTVGSSREKYEARKAVERVRGVVSVDDELQVRLMDHQKREDAELRADVLQALMLDGLMRIAKSGGKVTIEGTVSSRTEHDEAIEAVWSAPGVTSVNDQLKVVN
jgi:osmotically-inducible protein OsmY